MKAWELTRWCVGFTVLFFAFIFILNGFNEPALRINIRWSARFAAFYFSFAFMASSLQYFMKGRFSFWLLSNRKFVGISYAIVHLIHLSFLVLLQLVFHPVFEMAELTSLLGGGIAYFFTMVMLITSFGRFKTLLTPTTWKWIHTIGSYWIWSIFMISYLKRVDTEISYLPMILLVGLAFVLRIVKLFHSRFIKT